MATIHQEQETDHSIGMLASPDATSLRVVFFVKLTKAFCYVTLKLNSIAVFPVIQGSMHMGHVSEIPRTKFGADGNIIQRDFTHAASSSKVRIPSILFRRSARSSSDKVSIN